MNRAQGQRSEGGERLLESWHYSSFSPDNWDPEAGPGHSPSSEHHFPEEVPAGHPETYGLITVHQGTILLELPHQLPEQHFCPQHLTLAPCLGVKAEPDHPRDQLPPSLFQAAESPSWSPSQQGGSQAKEAGWAGSPRAVDPSWLPLCYFYLRLQTHKLSYRPL